MYICIYLFFIKKKIIYMTISNHRATYSGSSSGSNSGAPSSSVIGAPGRQLGQWEAAAATAAAAAVCCSMIIYIYIYTYL